MNTVTHVLVNAVVDRRVRERVSVEAPEVGTDRVGAPAPAAHPIATRAFLWGGALPDLPLIVMTVGAAAWFTLARDWTLVRSLEHVFRELYFVDPAWKVANNLLQSPTMLGLWAIAVLVVGRWWPGIGRHAAWFLAGAALHVALDLPVHHDDGPLVLFPFDWETRLHSPVSYWDAAHHGRVVSAAELVGVVGMSLYLLRYRIRRLWAVGR